MWVRWILDGLDADEEVGGDLAVAHPGGDEAGDGEFLRGEFAGVVVAAFGRRQAASVEFAFAAVEVGAGAERGESFVGGLQLGGRCSALPDSTQGLAVGQLQLRLVER